MHTHIFTVKPQKEYELIDSGDGLKMEKYGNIRIVRPDPQALWPKNLNETEWQKADAYFSKSSGGKNDDKKTNSDKGDSGEDRGKWIRVKTDLPDSWTMSFGDLTLQIELTPFKHTGVFPEQLNNWLWCRSVIEESIKKSSKNSQGSKSSENVSQNLKPKVLNLFGYTGGATLSASLAGAEVTHVDASRSAINWANENAKLSNLADKPIRWILEDAVSFVKRELRRGNKYDAIIMDPPAFGRGAKGEVWKIEESFLPLLEDCFQLLSDKPLFFVLNGYAAGYSAIAYENNLRKLVEKYGGEVESGELTIQESSLKGSIEASKNPEKQAERLLPCGIVSRWKAGL